MSKLDWGEKGLKDSDLLKKLYDVNNDSKYERLDLSWNYLTSLPDLRTFRQFDSLKELNLWHNKISDFDFSIIPPTVTWLDLSWNRLTHVGSLSHCTELVYLSVRSNRITQVDWRNLPPALTGLNLDSNQLTQVDWRNLPPALTELHLDSNQLTLVDWRNLPPALTGLYLGRNQLTHVDWRNLPPALTGLYLGRNQLTTVGDVSQCTRLSVLWVRDNHVTHIEWRNLPPALTRLYLGNNQLTTVDLIHCTQLEGLYLSDNPTLHTVESLPNKYIGYFYISKSAKVLGRKCFHENNYNMLKEECEKLQIYDLNLEQPPVELLLQGLEAVLEYYTEKSIRTTHTR